MHGCNAMNTALMARSSLVFMLVCSTQLLFHIIEMLIDIKLPNTGLTRMCTMGIAP